MFKLLAIFTICVVGIRAQIPYPDACPDYPVVENFDLKRYLGQWFIAEGFRTFFLDGTKCVRAMNYLGKERSSLQIAIDTITEKTGDPLYFSAESFFENEDEGKMNITIEGTEFIHTPCSILGTDYNNYAVVWGCKDNKASLWTLTRERNPSLEVLDESHAVMARNLIDRTHIFRYDQTDCPN